MAYHARWQIIKFSMKVAKRIKSRFIERHIDTQGQCNYKETQKQVLKHFSLVVSFLKFIWGQEYL